MIPRRILLLLLHVLFLLYAVPGFGDSPATTATIVVVHEESNLPVPGATLVVHSGSGKQTHFSTDEKGTVLLKLSPGLYQYTVRKEGLATRREYLPLRDKPTTVTIPLQREAIITGRVVTSSGKPLAGVRVSVSEDTSGYTDRDGRFAIKGVEEGWQQISVESTEWVAGKDPSFQIRKAERRELGDLKMVRPGTLTVRVTGSYEGKKRPITWGSVSVYGRGYHSKNIGNKGTVFFTRLVPGTHTIDAYGSGFSSKELPVEIVEGESRTVTLPVEVAPLELSLDEYRDVFLPESRVKCRLKGVWTTGATVRVYGVDRSSLVAGNVSLRQPADIPASALRHIKQLPVRLRPVRKGSSQTRATLTLPSLPAGAYVVEASAGKTVTRTGFLVTRLGLVAKVSPTGILLFATDLSSGKALADVSVAMIPANESTGERKQITTDANGILSLPPATGEMQLIGSLGDNLALLSAANFSDHRTKQLASFLYTERPVYRPGQTVYFKGVLRKRVGDDYALADMATIHLKALDAQEQTIFEQDIPITGNGTFAGELPLAADGPLGEYQLLAQAGQEDWQAAFDVLEYRKPEFEVKATPSKPYVLSGDPMEFTVTARTYTDAPLAGAQVQYRVYAKQGYQSILGREEEYPEYDDGGYADFINEGEATMDAAGKATVVIPTTESHEEMIYEVEFTVTDPSSREIGTSASIPVVPSLIALNVRSKEYITSPGATVPLDFTATDREGKPVSTLLSISVAEERSNGKTGKLTILPLEERKLTTDGAGHGSTTVALPRPGLWRVSATAVDARNRTATGSDTVWVWKQGYSWQSVWRELEMEFDKKSYRIGETAKLLIKAPATGGTLLLTLEGREIYQRRIIPLSSTVELVELPVTADFAPYVYVSAVTIHDRRYYNRTATINVQDQPHKLGITITADRPVYAPGDTVHLAVATRDSSGHPKAANLSLGVVDEAIYAISGEQDEDIYRFFRGKREHLVSTFNSFPRVYLGGASKDKSISESTVMGSKIKLRKLFKDTAFWSPEVTTDNAGEGAISFTLPDNLTTWRATAIGHTAGSDFGTSRQKFISRLDVMARLAPPRFFIQEDELSIPGMVTNMATEERLVKGHVDTVGLSLLSTADFERLVPAGSTIRHDLSARAEKPGEATIRLTADAGDRGDSLELTLPVLFRGVERHAFGNMVVQGNSAFSSVELPADALPGSATLDIIFSPTLLASLQDSLRELVEFPYGCVEQTMSRFLPAVYVQKITESGHAELPSDLSTKLPEVVKRGLRRIYDLQHEDGGWGWWENDSTNLAMTAYVVYGLSLAQNSGVTIQKTVLDKGTDALGKIALAGDGTLATYAYRSLTLSGARNPSLEEAIERRWSTFNPEQRLFYIEALLNLGEKDKATRLLAEVKKNVVYEGSAAKVNVGVEGHDWTTPWTGSAVEATAVLLENLLRIDRRDPLAPALAEYLVHSRAGRWWGSTSSTALVIKALAEFSGGAGSYEGDLSLNGQKVEHLKVENGKLVSGRSRISLPMAALATGSNRLTFERNNTSGAAFVSATLSCHLPLERASNTPGLSVSRSVSRLATRKADSRWVIERLPLKEGTALQVGDETEIELTVINRDQLDYVIIEDYLPAGFEVQNTREDGRFSADDYDGWSTYRERHDEKIAFFVTSLPPGEHHFRYVVKPELAGKMVALPSAIWPMYRPDLRSESAPLHLTVKAATQ